MTHEPNESARRAKTDSERPASPEILNDPEVRAKIEDALARVRDGRLRPGKSAEDLSRMIRAPHVDPGS